MISSDFSEHFRTIHRYSYIRSNALLIENRFAFPFALPKLSRPWIRTNGILSNASYHQFKQSVSAGRSILRKRSRLQYIRRMDLKDLFLILCNALSNVNLKRISEIEKKVMNQFDWLLISTEIPEEILCLYSITFHLNKTASCHLVFQHGGI